MKKKVLALVLCLAMVLSVLPMSVFAAENSNADDDFVIDENGVLTAYNGIGGDVVIPDGVTAIGFTVFAAKEITSVIIPDSVEMIDEGAFYNCQQLKSVTILGGAAIRGAAFYYCGNLTDLTINDRITDIHVQAFLCPALTNIHYPCDNDVDTIQTLMRPFGTYTYIPLDHQFTDNVCTVCGVSEFDIINGLLFDYNGNGGDVVIPDGVTSIRYEAFENCSSLTSVVIPNSVTSIGFSAFEGCTGLESITISDSAELGDYVFENCGNLENVYCPCSSDINAVKALMSPYGDYTYTRLDHQFTDNVCTLCGTEEFDIINGLLFGYNGNGGDVVIPDGVTSIRYEAFENCSSLTSVVIPNSVTSIGFSAFEGCSGLESITISDSAELGDYVFENCGNLENVYCPCSSDINAVKALMSPYGDYTYTRLDHQFENNVCTVCGIEEFVIEYDALVKYNGYGGDIVIPNGVDEISNLVFRGNRTITSITMPDVTKFGEMAFSDCGQLISVDMPKAKIIASSAFSGCYSLTTVNIPNVTIIQDDAFNGCISIKNIDISKATRIDDKAFFDCFSLASVTMNSKVNLDGNVFKNCFDLQTVYCTCDSDVNELKGKMQSYGNFKYVKSAHEFKNNVCESCGIEEFEILGDVLCGYNGKGGDVVIPDEVTEIAQGVFANNQTIKSVKMPNVVKVCDNAFSDCGNLTSADMPNVEYVGDEAFSDCNNLTSADMPKVADIKYDAFRSSGLKRIDISKATNVEDCAFLECRNLTSVTMNSRVDVPAYAFDGCSNLKTVYCTCNSDIAELEEKMQKFGDFTYIQLEHNYVDGLCDFCGKACEHTWANGVCTECGFAQFKFNSASLVLSGELVMDINCTVNDTEAVKDGYMEMTVGSTNTQKVCLADAVHNADGTYSFPCYLNVLQMADDITLSFHYGDTVVGPYTKSVAQYLNNIKTKYSDNAELVALAEAIADYGHFAQPALQEANGFEDGKYQTMNRISNAAFTLPDAADLASYKATKTGSVAQITNVSRALALDHGTDILLYFTCSGGYTPSITVTDKDGNPVACTLSPNASGKFTLTIPQISAHKLGDFYTVRIDNGAMEIKISALSYAYSVLKSAAASDAQKEAVAALYYYYQAAIAYQTAKN